MKYKSFYREIKWDSSWKNISEELNSIEQILNVFDAEAIKKDITSVTGHRLFKIGDIRIDSRVVCGHSTTVVYSEKSLDNGIVDALSTFYSK